MSSLRLLGEILFTRPWQRLALVLSACLSAIGGLLAAFAQKEFVDGLMGMPLVFPSLSLSPLLWLAVSFGALMFSLALSQLVNYIGSSESLWMQRQLADRLYRRVLRLQAADLRGRSIGEIVAIYTTDIPGSTILLEQSLPQGFSIIFPLLLAPAALIYLFGLSLALVLSLLGMVVALNLILAYRQSRFFFYFKKLAADRIGLVNEWIQNIRVLRVLGLIPAFERRIVQVREVETTNRIRMLTNGQSMNAISSSMTYLINVILVLALMKLHHETVTPGGLLALLWIVGIFLTRPFRQLPWFFTFVFDGWTSLKRLASALAMRSHHAVIDPTKPLNQNPDEKLLSPSSARPLALEVKGLDLQIQRHVLLSDISFQIRQGEFIAFVGEVGCGKSLLLQSLLGETPAHFHTYKLMGQDTAPLKIAQVRSQFAFVPQEGFTMSASLYENVIFDYRDDLSTQDKTASDLQAEKVAAEKALALADFVPERERLTEGLQTEIGERGVNLSGGQKQRISLARAIYSDAPILLLDDTFSALDTETEKKLIQNLLAGHWGARSRILMTHRLTILPEVDRIYFMAGGRIVESGTWTELCASSARFNTFVQSIQAAEEKALGPHSEVSK